jgi:hypothetical protein
MPKLSPEELLKSIDESPEGPDSDGDLEEILAMTPEQRVAELEALGYTRAELDAKADALFGRAVPAPAPGSATPEPPRPIPLFRRIYPYAVAAGLAGGGGLVWLSGLVTPDTLVATGQDAGLERSSLERARQLRLDAEVALDRQAGPEALRLLDEARQLDPAGDETAAVQRARARALAELPEGGNSLLQ